MNIKKDKKSDVLSLGFLLSLGLVWGLGLGLVVDWNCDRTWGWTCGYAGR